MTTTTPEGASDEPTLESLRELTESIRELRRSQRELRHSQAERSRELDRLFQDNAEQTKETGRLIRETAEQMQETDRQMQETDRQMQDTDRRMQETDRRLKRAENLFTTQWGKLMESLVEGDLVKLLRERQVRVDRLSQRTEGSRNGEHYELDILAVNGSEVVAVEVKTTLRPEDVGRFRAKLERFKEWWPEYEDRKVYGAMAYLQGGKDVRTHAERQGFFVIRATGSSSSIVNAEDFEPRVFA